jgi:hypothetical protein
MIALRLNHALSAAALFLSAFALWPWLVPPIPETRPLAVPSPAPAAAAAVPLPPLASFAATVERPLFSPSRRPAPAAVTAASPAGENRYRLIGIVANGPKKAAFVADNARRIEIVAGDTLDGWTVKEISQDRVTLISPAGEWILRLKPTATAPAKPQ